MIALFEERGWSVEFVQDTLSQGDPATYQQRIEERLKGLPEYPQDKQRQEIVERVNQTRRLFVGRSQRKYQQAAAGPQLLEAFDYMNQRVDSTMLACIRLYSANQSLGETLRRTGYYALQEPKTKKGKS